MVEKRDRSTSDTAQTRRTRQTFDAFQAGDRRLSATHFEDGYDAFPACCPPWLGERAPEFGDTAVWATALSVSLRHAKEYEHFQPLFFAARKWHPSYFQRQSGVRDALQRNGSRSR